MPKWAVWEGRKADIQELVNEDKTPAEADTIDTVRAFDDRDP